MIMTQDIFNYFSSPNNDEFEVLLTEMSKHLFLQVVRRTVALGAADSEEVTSLQFLGELVETSNIQSLWMPELGHILSVSLRNLEKKDFNWLKDQLFVCAHMAGVTDTLEIKQQAYSYGLRLGGKLWGQTHPVSIKADKNKIFVTNREKRTPYFSRRAHNGRLFWFSNDERVVPGEAQIRMIEDSVFDQGNNPQFFSKEELNFFTKDIERALKLLYLHSPAYYRWVVASITEISLVPCPEEKRVTSSSIFHQFGTVRLSMPASTYEIMDMLVHEASHQYLNLIWSQGPLVTPDATPLYSPLKRAARPMHMVLAGYHAFANVYLMQQQVKGLDEIQAQLTSYSQQTKNYIDELGIDLSKRLEQFTELGRSLYIPLYSQLN